MQQILLLGAGKIGSLIACLLENSGDYFIHWADISFDDTDCQALCQQLSHVKLTTLDAQNEKALQDFLSQQPIDAIISSLPYFCNILVAEQAKKFTIHYFDLTEDTTVTKRIAQLADNAESAFVPQCGLAPGFINIVTEDLIEHFDTLHSVKLRVGALPVNSSNALHYSLTWSTDGLINEYGNLCTGIEDHQLVQLLPLEGLETIQIDGLPYEAFNTSGGLGHLAQRYQGKVQYMNYKTLRYPGHCEKMRLLMNDLKLNQDRDTLKRILQTAIPKTYQDVVLIYVAVTGWQNGRLMEENYVKKIYPQTIANRSWSAIQVTTASGICSVVDIILQQKDAYRGIVYQDQFALQHILDNRFGVCYQ